MFSSPFTRLTARTHKTIDDVTYDTHEMTPSPAYRNTIEDFIEYAIEDAIGEALEDALEDAME